MAVFWDISSGSPVDIALMKEAVNPLNLRSAFSSLHGATSHKTSRVQPECSTFVASWGLFVPSFTCIAARLSSTSGRCPVHASG
jgi:hypothetical protein